ncbi:pentatricopeptide repeat-containing protein At4g01990, mitochondrial-like [Oryza brachyantha]|uniref:Pentacotripeptide-repeat region of PRORP domain-containing protein n=1 Tax=Oryza brachyantha TaxID=4533 RepID=J3KZ36_ORYBR|nr:pentatricopeptide repeat-containing protein At4g01990, mitochondrial-like [Oryza brachyantha]
MLRAAAAAARRRVSSEPGRLLHAVPDQRELQGALWPLYARLSAQLAATAGSSGTVAEELGRWLRERRPLSEEQLLFCVHRFRKFKQNRHALELMDWMEARGVNLQLKHHALRLDLVSKVNGIHAAQEYFWSLPDVFRSVKTYCTLLNCYAEHGMADKGLELFENMKAMNMVSDILVYNNLMCLFLKTGQPEKIPTTFVKLQESGMEANNFSYFVLTESYIMMNDIESAEKVLKELQKMNSVPWSLYTTIANGYIKLQQYDKAELALKKAEEVLDKHDAVSWHFLLSLYARSGNLSEVKRIWENLKSAFKKCTNRSYLVMLKALKRLDDFDSMQQIFQEWESSQEQYDMNIPNVIIQAYLDKGMTDKAEAMRQTSMSQGHSNYGTFFIFAEFYLEKSKINEALQVWRDAKNMLKGQNWVPSKLVSRFLKHFEDSKDADGMEAFCECLRKLDWLDAEAYEALIRTYISAGRTNPSIVQRIEDDRVDIRPEMVELLRAVSTEGGKEGVQS